MRTRILWALFACFIFIATASAQDMSYKPAATTKFGPHPALPACGSIAVQDGNPASGPSTIALRAKPGCVFAWHWHTPNERLIVVRGTARVEMKDGKPVILHPGDFIFLPAKHVHQASPRSPPVELFDMSDAPFDMHYVDAAGKEITPAEAFKK